MLPDRVSNPGPLTYESGALPIALHGPALPKREKEREKIDEKKCQKQPQPASTASAIGSCPTIIQISRPPRH